MPYTPSRIVGLLLGPLLFVLTLWLVDSPGLSEAGRGVLATTLWMTCWWVLEVIPIAATALLPLLLFPLTGSMGAAAAAAPYANPLVFLVMAGFMLAAAIQKWGLHRRIGLRILSAVGGKPAGVVLGFMLACGFLSMWISNTATAVMMLPIGLAVAGQLSKEWPAHAAPIGSALMLSIAYSCSIGGMASLIGTPTNVVFSGMVLELYGIEIDFARWMSFGLPVSACLMAVAWWYLTRIAFKLPAGGDGRKGREAVNRQLAELGKLGSAEKTVALVFVCVALSWMLRNYLLRPLLPAINDAMIGMVGVLILFVLPVRSTVLARGAGRNGDDKRGRILDWRTVEGIPWGILVLFGGGLSLAGGFSESGLADWIGGNLGGLKAIPLLVLLLIVATAVNFLTELTSNVATASVIVPVLAALAASAGVHPYALMIGATFAAGCAFMLPVATPPNAVVFGSGYLDLKTMMRVGLWMNLISVVVVSLLVYVLLPLIWGIDLSVYPVDGGFSDGG